MFEEQLKSLIEQDSKELEDMRKTITKIYKMEFGEIAIQYDCCLN